MKNSDQNIEESEWSVFQEGRYFGVCREKFDGDLEVHYPGFKFKDEQSAQRLADDLNWKEEYDDDT